uniref:TIGR01212 family radical SAM protein n=1 Tax=Desulfobacca sp. TaxID=2067990 RepID=UPI00404A4D4A
MIPALSPALPYYSLKDYLQSRFGERVQKVTLDAGLTCPNRDGRVGWGGCIYCNARGSGTGAAAKGQTLAQQLAAGIARLSVRYQARKVIAYFQSFSNTYAPLPRLREMYDQVLAHPQVVGLSIGTRPDCLSPAILDLLASYSRSHLVWLELGLQSAHDRTLRLLNRGHDVACFTAAVHQAAAQGLQVLAHVILGLPGEDRADMLATARLLATLPLAGVKMHLLYIIKGTQLADLFVRGDFQPLSLEDYVDIVVSFLELLPSHFVIHRLTGDPHPAELLAPAWCLDKRFVLQQIKKTFLDRQTCQGRLWQPTL